MMPRMRIMTGLAGWALAGVLMLTGCAPKQGPVMQGDSPKLGVLSRVEDPAAVAGARSFYVQPNGQLSMSNSFVAGTSLQQVFADRIAGDLVKRGLTQGPPDMADLTVVYTVHDLRNPHHEDVLRIQPFAASFMRAALPLRSRR